MRFIFFGTPEFAAIILEKLIAAGFIPETVVCNPDKPVGRKKIIAPPPTKLLAQKYNISVLQPKVLLNSEFRIQNLEFDFFVVAAYSQIIPKEILEIPRFGTIGVHPSLLPKYRGATPIQTAILNGDEETGTTLYLMDEKMDHGEILATSHLPLATSDNYEILMRKLAELSADLLIKTLPDIEEKIKSATIQNESQATYIKKFKTEDAFIKPEDLEEAENDSAGSPQVAAKIDRKIRALNPEPGAWTYAKALTNRHMRINENKRVKLLEAEIKDGKLKLKKIQIEGKNPTEIKN